MSDSKQTPIEWPFLSPPPRRRRLWGWTGIGDKTLWDWLQLLILPAVVALGATIGTAWFTGQRAQEEALQNYLKEVAPDPQGSVSQNVFGRQMRKP